MNLIPHHTAVARLRRAGYTVRPIEHVTKERTRIVGLTAERPGMATRELKAQCFAYCELDLMQMEDNAAKFEPLTSEGR